MCGTCLANSPIEPHSGVGILKGFIRLNLPLTTGLQTPVLIGELELAPGITRQAVLDVIDPNLLYPDQALQAIGVPSNEPDHYDCVFRTSNKEES